ncbi:MAG: hypothetical protein LAQ30_08455 [Acidobacteriia bacterium]|nr:hypothetical protein [Terriglobia bacterium]
MPRKLLLDALARAEGAEPEIRAAALLHGARVLAEFDQQEAERILEEGLALTAGLPERQQGSVMESAVRLAAAVAPQRAVALLESVPRHRHRLYLSSEIVRVMIEHGRVEAAVAYLMADLPEGDYPYLVVVSALQRCAEGETRLRVLRGAIRAWRRAPDAGFLRLFSQYWTLLPEEEARGLLRAIVEVTLRERDMPGFNGGVFDVAFRSTRQYRLFEVLNVLRRLEPELADSLVAQQPELAAAAERFPEGMESAMAEAQVQARARAVSAGAFSGGFGMGGHPRDFPAMKAMMEAERHGSVEPHFEEAQRLYEEDSDRRSPNLAARECWPSTQAYRQALYAAGKLHGRDAIVLLERVPDLDIRVLAQIELAAALAGLPEVRGSRATFRPPER